MKPLELDFFGLFLNSSKVLIIPLVFGYIWLKIWLENKKTKPNLLFFYLIKGKSVPHVS